MAFSTVSCRCWRCHVYHLQTPTPHRATTSRRWKVRSITAALKSLNSCIFLDDTYFPGRAATIYYRSPAEQSLVGKVVGTGKWKDKAIGELGVLHPTVLQNFDINFPCSALEFDLTSFEK